MAYKRRKGASLGQVLLLVLLIFVMLAGVGYLVYTQVFSGPAFVEKTVELVYQRDILRDGGKAQRLESFVSTGVPLSGVFSKERLVSFDPPQGVGLSVVFRTMSGTTVQKVEKFTLEPWRSYYETDHPVRKSRVRAKQAEFEAMAAKFARTVEIDHALFVVLDTTSGVGDVLAKRVKETIDTILRASPGISCKQDHSVMYAYLLTGDQYQGERKISVLCPGELTYRSALEWLLQKRRPEQHSAVMAGLAAVFGEVHEYRANHPFGKVVVHVFTDGIENTPTYSFLRPPAAQMAKGDKSPFDPVDRIFGIGQLTLTDVDVHLHEIQTTSARDTALMHKALEYLKIRLGERGAKVVVDRF